MDAIKSAKVRLATWVQDADSIKRVRLAVFVAEQKVPLELEFDGLDEHCKHWLALDAGGCAVGTARMLADGHIGRMAVLAANRQQGVGSQIMKDIINIAKETGFKRLQLHAQITAMPFYSRLGFVAYGEQFMDADMSHIAMELALDL